MTNENDGAFAGEGTDAFHDGLTKREYFASAVMSGFASDHNHSGTLTDAANYAVKWADALIVALNKDKPE